MSFFNDIPQLPEDPILGLPILFNADIRPKKINLGIGAYKTAEGLPLVLTSVRKAEQSLLQKQFNKEYLPIEGDAEFLRYSLALLFGTDCLPIQSGQFFTAQTVGGASALRIAGEFLVKHVSKLIFIPQPTWTNHRQIFEMANLKVGSYPYIDNQTTLLDFKGLVNAIRNIPKRSIILLHGCCHNPTGIDPTFEQWKELSHLIKLQQLIPIFDMAYQGFGDDLDKDAQAIRYFANEGHEMFVAYSFSKNFGLYGERVGFLTVCCSKKEIVPKIGSQIKALIRGNYSNPPIHGARIVATILKSLELSSEWKMELRNMRERIQEMRKSLVSSLLVGTDKNFSFILQQKGLFSFLGLTAEQVLRLRHDYAIYMSDNGRINNAGITIQNIPEITKAISAVI